MKRARLVLCGLLLAATGCSVLRPSTHPSQPTQAATTDGATPQSTATPGGATPASSSGGATPGTITPASDCLTGTYRLARFVAVSYKATYGTGEGGDVTVTFTQGSYRLKGAGKKPITLAFAGQQGSLLVAGSIGGDYKATGDKADFTIRRASGSGRLTALGKSRTLAMKEVGNVLGLTGSGTLGCSPKLLTVTLDNVRLELEKV
jgi:hypothetical protein